MTGSKIRVILHCELKDMPECVSAVRAAMSHKEPWKLMGVGLNGKFYSVRRNNSSISVWTHSQPNQGAD